MRSCWRHAGPRRGAGRRSTGLRYRRGGSTRNGRQCQRDLCAGAFSARRSARGGRRGSTHAGRLCRERARMDASIAVTAIRTAGGRLIGFNTNGIVSPGRCKVGGIGGDRTTLIYRPGRIGVCSRSGGMSAEVSYTLGRAGLASPPVCRWAATRSSGCAWSEDLRPLRSGSGD